MVDQSNDGSSGLVDAARGLTLNDSTTNVYQETGIYNQTNVYSETDVYDQREVDVYNQSNVYNMTDYDANYQVP